MTHVACVQSQDAGADRTETLISLFLQLQERYPWSGQAVQVRRRDFRRGESLPLA